MASRSSIQSCVSRSNGSPSTTEMQPSASRTATHEPAPLRRRRPDRTPGPARPARWHAQPGGQLGDVFRDHQRRLPASSKIGMYMRTTTPPIARPSTAIRTGSKALVNHSTVRRLVIVEARDLRQHLPHVAASLAHDHHARGDRRGEPDRAERRGHGDALFNFGSAKASGDADARQQVLHHVERAHRRDSGAQQHRRGAIQACELIHLHLLAERRDAPELGIEPGAHFRSRDSPQRAADQADERKSEDDSVVRTSCRQTTAAPARRTAASPCRRTRWRSAARRRTSGTRARARPRRRGSPGRCSPR